MIKTKAENYAGEIILQAVYKAYGEIRSELKEKGTVERQRELQKKIREIRAYFIWNKTIASPIGNSIAELLTAIARERNDLP